MAYRISGLDPAPFRPLFGLADAALAPLGVERHRADRSPGFPDRVTLRDLLPGETALLLNYTHQPANTPYRASHAIFVREGTETAATFVDEIPPALRIRTLSLRGFDAAGHLRGAALAEGAEAGGAIARLFADERIAYLHIHYAAYGCYAARAERL